MWLNSMGKMQSCASVSLWCDDKDKLVEMNNNDHSRAINERTTTFLGKLTIDNDLR
jgi:hypothetical protein